MRIALTIAGSDPSAGAGVQADLKTFTALGVYGVTAITALTVQNTEGVIAVHPVEPATVAAQIDAVVEDLGAHATKIGMLGNAAIVEAVAQCIDRHGLANVVLDTVLRATAGPRLIDADGAAAIRTLLLPRARVVTPNLAEAAALTGIEVTDLTTMRRAAAALLALGAQCVVVTGGHLEGRPVDVFADAEGTVELEGERVETRHSHGTGCTFSAALAAGLALGDTPVDAARRAKTFVTHALRTTPGLGRGRGPLGHQPLY
jgi:hydroxymethylpyrimidine/phosphomethylpyrimidine kinase